MWLFPGLTVPHCFKALKVNWIPCGLLKLSNVKSPFGQESHTHFYIKMCEPSLGKKTSIFCLLFYSAMICCTPSLCFRSAMLYNFSLGNFALRICKYWAREKSALCVPSSSREIQVDKNGGPATTSYLASPVPQYTFGLPYWKLPSLNSSNKASDVHGLLHTFTS